MVAAVQGEPERDRGLTTQLNIQQVSKTRSERDRTLEELTSNTVQARQASQLFSGKWCSFPGVTTHTVPIAGVVSKWQSGRQGDLQHEIAGVSSLRP